MAASDKITVAVRVRPLGEHGVNDIVVQDSATSSLVIGVDRSFQFDHIFPPESEQNFVFDTLVAPLITDCLRGINATVLAYGQTGSGKTYTMGTSYNVEDFSMTDSVGIIPRAIVHLFDQIAASEDGDIAVEAQLIELYNEELRDLLTPKKNIVKIQEKPGGGIYLSGATMVRIHSVNDALELIRAGGESRSTGSTKMNAQSSRSHAILTLHINQRMKDEDNARVELKSSKFHFVDLAGSERLGRTGAEGERAKEGIKINYGLLALGNVINALSENQKHVPYRDSKLTRLLCDSLGGNSRTVLIACISPAEIDMAESINTLQYATRAKKIRNTISINVANMTSADAVTLKKLQAENHRLRQQLKAVSQTGARARSAPYSRSPGQRPMSAKPSLPLRARENLSQIASSFDKIMSTRMRQMTEITRVGASRFQKMLELTNVRLQHTVLAGCGDPQAQQLLIDMRALEKEIDDAATQVTNLAEALRKSAAATHDLLGKVERAIRAFPPYWQHVPQTVRSAMSTRLSNSDSAGLQCYNSNLIHILQLSQAEQERSLATVQQLNQIAGPSLLRRYLPTLLNNVSSGYSMRPEAFDDGTGIRQEGPSISSLLPGLFDGSVKNRPGTTRSVSSTKSATIDAARRLGISRKPIQVSRTAGAPVAAAGSRRPTSVLQQRGAIGGVLPTTKPTASRVSYVAAVGCDHMPDEYLTALEPAAPQAAACLSCVLPLTSNNNPLDATMRVSPFCATDEDDDGTLSVEMTTTQPLTASSISSTKHHQVPLSTRVVWHNGLPLPVVDSPEQENRPPLDVSMPDASKTSRVDFIPDASISGDVLRPLLLPTAPLPPVQSAGTKRSLATAEGLFSASRDLDPASTIINTTMSVVPNGATGDVPSSSSDGTSTTVINAAFDDTNPEREKRTRFTLRRSIMERFQRCGIDFRTFAPP